MTSRLPADVTSPVAVDSVVRWTDGRCRCVWVRQWRVCWGRRGQLSAARTGDWWKDRCDRLVCMCGCRVVKSSQNPRDRHRNFCAHATAHYVVVKFQLLETTAAKLRVLKHKGRRLSDRAGNNWSESIQQSKSNRIPLEFDLSCRLQSRCQQCVTVGNTRAHQEMRYANVTWHNHLICLLT